MGRDDLQMAMPLYVAMLVGVLVYTIVWWRIFNKAHRSGILLLWGLISAAVWPWISDPGEWFVVGAVGVSFLVSLGVASTMVSIIGRPLWWVLPVALAFLPQLAIVIWATEASAYEDTPEAIATLALASWVAAVVMATPLYFIGMHDLGDAFGYGTGFQLGLMFLPLAFLPIVAFGSNHYGDWGLAKRRRAAALSPVPRGLATAPAPPSRKASLPPLNGGATPVPADAVPDQPVPDQPVPDQPVPDQPDAGWYTDPDGSGGLRWWDGNGWTGRIETAANAAAHEPQWDRH